MLSPVGVSSAHVCPSYAVTSAPKPPEIGMFTICGQVALGSPGASPVVLQIPSVQSGMGSPLPPAARAV